MSFFVIKPNLTIEVSMAKFAEVPLQNYQILLLLPFFLFLFSPPLLFLPFIHWIGRKRGCKFAIFVGDKYEALETVVAARMPTQGEFPTCELPA